MLSTKSIFASQTIHGLVVMAAAAYAPQILAVTHVDNATLAATIHNVGIIVGGVLATIGRIKADKPLHLF